MTRKLQSLDDMFMLSKNEEVVEEIKSINEIEIEKLTTFHDHSKLFKLYEGKRLDDLVNDIKDVGVLVPVLVQPLENGKYEILAGHNRVNAARTVGLSKVPCRVVEGLSEEEAVSYVIRTNLFQRSFSELSYSEKITAITELYKASKKQGARIDLMKNIDINSDFENNNASDITSQSYDLSPAMIKRYVKLSELNKSFIEMLDDGTISSNIAYEIAFITPREQQLLESILSVNKLKLDIKKATLLKANSGKLNENMIFDILSGNLNKKPKKGGTGFKIKSSILNKYFGSDVNNKEIEEVIEKALEIYFNTNEREDNLNFEEERSTEEIEQ